MPKSILDPFSGFGLNLIRLTKEFVPEKALGLTQNSKEHETAVLLGEKSSVQWLQGDSLVLLDQISDNFDLITSCLPWATKSSSLQLTSNNGLIELHDQIGTLILLKSLMLLKQNGLGIFVLTLSFFSQYPNSLAVYNNLFNFEFFVEGVFLLSLF